MEARRDSPETPLPPFRRVGQGLSHFHRLVGGQLSEALARHSPCATRRFPLDDGPAFSILKARRA
jgi:hypothetical protein